MPVAEQFAPGLTRGPGTAHMGPRQPLPAQPTPALLKLGYTGDINTFNARVESIVQAHQTEFGYMPSPGLVLDIARSTVNDQLLPHLFDGHSSPQTYGVLNKDRRQNPHEWMQPRGDGLLQHFSPFAQGQRYAPAQAPPLKFKMIPDGYLPVPGFHDLIGAIQQIDTAGKAGARQQAQLAGAYAGTSSPTTEMLREAQAMERGDIGRGATTVKGAQQHLRTLAPEFFGTLPADGAINSDWAKAINTYQHSLRYNRDSLKQLASDNGLSPADYVRAWDAKTKFVQSHALLAHMASSIPIQFWATNDVAGAFWRYETAGVHGGDYVTAPIHMAVKTGELLFGVAGGTFSQLASDTGAMNAYLGEIASKWAGGSGATQQEAIKFASEVARKSPDLLNTFFPRVAAHLEGSKVLGMKGYAGVREADQIATFAALLLSGHPKVTGVKIAAGDVGGLLRSQWFKSGTQMAWNSVRKGEPLGVAVKTLDGTAGEKLILAAEKNPNMTLAEFRQQVAQSYHQGEPIFDSLRSYALQTPKAAGIQMRYIQHAVGRMAADFEQGLAKSGFRGTDNAVAFAHNLTNLTRRAVPQARKIMLFGPTAYRSPDDVYNWAQKTLGNTTQAHRLRDEFIRLRNNNDVSGLTKFEDKLYALTRDKYGRGEQKVPQGETFTPLIESHLPAYLSLPAPEILSRAQRINKTLNKIGRRHRQLIMFGPFQVTTGFKHALADTGRRTAADVGQLFGLSTDGKLAKAELETLLAKDPAARRTYSVTQTAARQSEARYITGYTLADRQSFNLGDLRASGTLNGAHLDAAAKYLRGHLNDEALRAYLKSSADDLKPLEGYVLGNKAVRQGILLNDPKYEQTLRELNDRIGGEPFAATKIDIAAGGLRQELAAEHAKIIYARYKEIDQALKDAKLGIEDMDGKTEKELASLLDKNRVALPVHSGQVSAETRWDNVTRRWIGTIMAPNKWNRSKMFNYVLHETLADAKRGGVDIKDALPMAAEVALKQTTYHMLDFANMLQAEQDFRWVSYFATKHRLYWSWVAKHFIGAPGQAYALQQAAHELNLQNGNLNFAIGGKGWYIPVERLLWVNAKDYPETSPPLDALSGLFGNLGKGPKGAAAAAFAGVVGTSGNVLSRDDQVFLSLYRLARAETGTSYSFMSATQGMAPTQKKVFADAMVEFAIGYQAEHGHLPTEAEATKMALLRGTWTEALRANIPLIIPKTGTPESIKTLDTQYRAITDPAKRTEFLDQHPLLSMWFGHTQPDVWWHNQPLWAKFNAARNQLEQAKQRLLESARLPTGTYNITPDVLRQMRQLSAQWGQTLTELQAEDANSWAGNAQLPAGHATKIAGTWVISKPGPWGRQLSGDPVAATAWLHQVFPDVPMGQLNAKSTTDATVELRRVQAILKQPDGAKLFGLPAKDAHTILADINNQLSVLYAYPKNATAQAEQTYYAKYLIPYIKEREAKRGQPVPAEAQALYDQNFRMWRQGHDHPVKITVEGKTFEFPSVVQYGYAMQPAPIRQGYIDSFAHDNPLNLAPYELKMLYGTNLVVGKDLAEAQTLFTTWLNEIGKQVPPVTITKAYRDSLAKAVQNYYPNSGFANLYKWSQAPKIRRFEISQPYKLMPAPAKALFDEYVGTPAKQYAQAVAANKNYTYYAKYWRHYIDSPYLQNILTQNPVLKTEIAKYGANFLYTLVGSS